MDARFKFLALLLLLMMFDARSVAVLGWKRDPPKQIRVADCWLVTVGILVVAEFQSVQQNRIIFICYPSMSQYG